MKKFRKFKPFQIRWKEKLGNKDDPYLYRWTILFFNFSIRIHHWIKSDDTRAFHDHSCNFISFLIKGEYQNVTPSYSKTIKAPFIWFSKAENIHHLIIDKKGAWTILFCGRPYRKWKFWINDIKSFRPLRYFHRYGIINK
jgi:hypothetical protein